jgi:hypothetical protein
MIMMTMDMEDMTIMDIEMRAIEVDIDMMTTDIEKNMIHTDDTIKMVLFFCKII